MTIPKPEHFFQQARRLVELRGRGAPRQVDVRRAISAAYYGTFHFILAEAADQFVGVAQRNAPTYALAYRSIDHKTLKKICEVVRRTALPENLKKYIPGGQFSDRLKEFSDAVIALQEKRSSADYDPSLRFSVSDSTALVEAAESAVEGFRSAVPEERRAFLALLVFHAR